MRAPLSWLRDYSPLEAPLEDLVSTLSGLGLVVEGVAHVGSGLEGVVVASILAIRPHPDAERVRLCDVDAGDGQVRQVVCGAWNMSAGDLVPLAPVGTVLPGRREIGRRQVRGQWSEGMLCSASELELPSPPDEEAGLMILPPGLAPPGTPLVEALDLAPDVVLDLEVAANRPDAMCMAGVARDLAAALRQPWGPPTGPAAPAPDPGLGAPPVEVEAPELCPRLTATLLEGVPGGPSPAWMARRLTLAGMRPISAVVDVSNYVMLDIGQPNHAYDRDRLAGGGLVARRARPKEVLRTLDGVERELLPEDCVIADHSGKAVGIGGIMGGADAEVSASTETVLLEAAYFDPMAIARTGSRLGLRSEARYRFERGVDPELPPRAVERFVALLASIGEKGRLRRGPTTDCRPGGAPASSEVRVRTARVNAVLGTSLSDREVLQLIEPIGFEAAELEPGVHSVRIPSWRPDSTREIDVIEEVARMWGYGRIERTIPSGKPGGSGGLTPYQRGRRRVREIMAGAGLSEAWTSSFLGPSDLERAGLPPTAVAVANPLDRSESLLRPGLLPGLLKALRFNADRQLSGAHLFEVGNVFAPPQPGSQLPVESEELGAVLAGEDAAFAARLWEVLARALRLEGTVLSQPSEAPGLHPTRSAAIVTGASGRRIGAVGEVDPAVVEAFGLAGRVGWLSVGLAGLLGAPRRPWAAREPSRYPASDIDLAFVVDEAVPAAQVAATLRAAGGELLEEVCLFDVYRGEQVGEGRRSLAYHLRFRAPDRTLGEAELAAARQRAIEAVAAAHGASLRG